MDLLSQYKQQNPEAFREQKSPSMTDMYGREYSGMVRLVMRLSGGRIQTLKRAHYVLVGMAALFVLMAVIILLIFNANNSGESSSKEVERLMREAPPPSVVEPQFIR